ncbi:MAG: hypothetical protein ACM3MF_10165 [Anaerolineae bacterium]
MLRLSLLLLTLAALLTGCVLPGEVSAPTPYPPEYLPTVIFLTAQAINAATLLPSATPSATDLPPTETPTQQIFAPLTPPPTVTFTPGPGVPLAAVQINAPGPMSRVASPLEVHALVVAGDSHRVEVALFGEDGRLLGRTLLVVSGFPGGNAVSVKMPFEIRAAGETGTLQISTKDGHGHVQSLNSVRLLLMSTGSTQMTPPGNMIYERVAFYDLPIDSHITGGTLAVRGSYTPMNDKPVILELMTADGKSIGLRVLDLHGRQPQYFETTIPYKVTQETAARLYLYQDDDVIAGRAYIYSQPIALEP